MGRGTRAAAILLAGVLLGAFRDFLFVNLNYQIDHVRRATPDSFAHSRFQRWVAGWDLSDLLRWKWILAGLCSLSMWALCVLLLRNAQANSRLARPVTLLFGAIALAAVLLHVLGRWLPNAEEASVNLLHAIQYPVLLLVLWIGLLLFPGVRSERS